MSYHNVQVLLQEDMHVTKGKLEQTWFDYLEKKKDVYSSLLPHLVDECLISEANFVLRGRSESGKALGIYVEEGDICYLDYGQTYLNEMGYQHLGLVMKVVNNKALVIPITSNECQYRNAYDPIKTPKGKRHLMRIGKPKGLKKPSVLFLNDMRFINTARIIETFSHIDVDSKLYRSIQLRIMEVLFCR